MVQTVSITESITTLDEAEAKFNLVQRNDPKFFQEWFEDLPELSDNERRALARLQQRYLFHQRKGLLSEGTVQIVAITPLLDLAGLCDPPFLIRTEEAVRIEVDTEDTIFQGRLDILVVQGQFWVLVVEEKRGSLNSSVAIPQTLAYMAANPCPERPTFALVTNGEDYQFIKLAQPDALQYGLSDKFTLMTIKNDGLQRVLQILKRIGEAIAP